MNEWITDRLPTIHDADRNGYVWCTDYAGMVCITNWENFAFDTSKAWMIRDLPEPYVPPKPKRASVWMDGNRQMWNVAQKSKNCEREYKEVMPGDPDNLDAFLEAFDIWFAVIEKRQSYPDWGWGPLARVMIKARKPKELCPHGYPPRDCNKCDWDSDSVNDIAREQ